MNRRRLGTVVAGFFGSLFLPRIGRADTSEVRVAFVTVGGDLTEAPMIPGKVSEETLASLGVKSPHSQFALMPGPLEGIFWPVMENGLWSSTNHALLAHAHDEETVWMCPIIAKRVVIREPSRQVRYEIGEGVQRAISRFPSRKGWHVVHLDSGMYPINTGEED